MNRIKEIELLRIANILVYFANNTECFGVTKANKLLYYLDCYHLLRHGRTVIKDKYKKYPLGPVPSETYERLNIIKEFNSFPKKDRGKFDFRREIMFKYITVITENISSVCTIDKIVAKKDFECRWFSKSEIEIMEELSEKYKYTSATDLSAKTHKESPYKKAKEYGFIDLKLFLKDNNVSKEYMDYVIRREKEIEAIALNYQGY